MSFEYELEDEFEKNSGTPTPKGGFKTSKNDYENTTNNFAGEKNKLNSSSKKVAKSSINFQKVNIHAFKHNAREEEKKANTIFEEYIKDNLFLDIDKPKVIISTVGDELHNLGIKIVGKFLESNGFSVKNLGSKLSNKELINSIYELKPDLVILSVTLPSNVATLQQIVKELKSDYNLFLGKIIIGGQGLFVNNKMISIKEADFCSKNLEDLKIFLKTLNYSIKNEMEEII